MLSASCKRKAPDIEWQKNLGGSKWDCCRSLCCAPDGGVVVAGIANSNDGDVKGNHGLSDYWIVKLDSAGNIQWQKCFGGSYYDECQCILHTLDGGYIAVGLSYSDDGQVEDHHGSADIWIVRMDAEGNPLWKKNLGGSAPDYAYSIVQSIDRGYVVAGQSKSSDGDSSLNEISNHRGNDVWLIKLDFQGEIEWQKTYGGSKDDFSQTIQQTSDGGYVVAANTASSDGDVKENNGEGDIWIIKVDGGGIIQWQKSLGSPRNELVGAIRQTSDDGFIVAGQSSSSYGEAMSEYGLGDCWIIKLDEKGNLQWEKKFGGMLNEAARDVRQTANGNYIVAAFTNSMDDDVKSNHGLSDFWLFELDPYGKLLWEKTLGGSGFDLAYCMQLTEQGNILIGGESASNDGDLIGNQGNKDCWVVKLKAK